MSRKLAVALGKVAGRVYLMLVGWGLRPESAAMATIMLIGRTPTTLLFHKSFGKTRKSNIAQDQWEYCIAFRKWVGCVDRGGVLGDGSPAGGPKGE